MSVIKVIKMKNLILYKIFGQSTKKKGSLISFF